MKKTFKKLIRAAFVSLMIMVLCSCGKAGTSQQSGKLDLDYEQGSSSQTQQEEKQSGNWFSEAFSFGKKEENKPSSGQSTQSSALEDLYNGSSESTQQNSAGNNQGTSSQSAQDQSSQSSSGTFQGGGSGQGGTTPAQQTGSNTGQNGIAGNGNGSQGGSGNQSQGSGKTVTITIRCDTAVKNGMHLESKWAGIVPASGCILPVTTVEIEDGQTVFDVLAFVCDKYKIHMSYRGGTASGCYVEGINNLFEFDGGRWSGWMYCVNKWYPNYGCGVYYVKPGDEIEWNYTCDLGLDLEGGDILGGEEWIETHP